jgi:predicted transposase YbfD/YdcC
MTIYGSLWGHTDFTNMAMELKYHEKFFTEILGLENGVPSHDTLSAVFGVIDTAAFTEGFITWITGIVRAKGGHVAIDGKAVKAACDKVHKGRMPYLVNAFITDLGLCIGQLKVDEKTNEIKGIPELLDWLDLEGAVVTVDAIGCQREIAEKLKEKGADFVLPAKENQPTLHADILFEIKTREAENELAREHAKKLAEKGLRAPLSDKAFDVYEQLEKGHGRIERRRYSVLNDSSCVDKELWPHVKSIGLVIRERMVIKRDADGEIVDEKPSVECVTYIMSREMKAEEFACYVRGHWGVENSLHWVLDDCFREDRCTARKNHAMENLGLLRKILLNLMKLDANTAKMSMRAKQVYYRNDPDAVFKLLFEEIPNKYSPAKDK